MRKLLTTLALCLCATNAQAAYKSGNDLLTACKAEGLTCYGYITAAQDTYEAWVDWGLITEKRMCVPHGVSAEQLRLVVLKYMESKPEALHLNAGSFVLNALIVAFPCK
tara:strand:- start:356 stop:682 length:327 start_codon:yes stop_codon:yes gene_type:complete